MQVYRPIPLRLAVSVSHKCFSFSQPQASPRARASSNYRSMAEAESSYSIWLVPDPAEDFYKRVATEIEHWALKKNSPVFPPHVTLIGGIKGTEDDVLSKTEALAKQLTKYAVSCADVEMADTRHQCVFLRCNTEQRVMQASDTASKAFGLQTKPYMPHCSLLYSDISTEERQIVVEQARERLYGALQGYQGLLCTTGFWVTSLHVYETPFPAYEGTWKEVGVFQLPE